MAGKQNHKKADLVLSASECIADTDFLMNVFNGIRDAVIILDPAGRIMCCNGKTCDLLGMDVGSVIGSGDIPALSADDINTEAFSGLFESAAAGRDSSFTWRLKSAQNGRAIDVDVFLTRIKKSGSFVVMACVRDITDKKKIEDELVDSESRYRQLVEFSPNGIVIHRDGRIKYVNPAGAAMLGGTEEEVTGSDVAGFFLKDDGDLLRDRLRRLYENKESLPITEGRLRRMDGRTVYVEYAAIPFMLDGRTAVQVVLRDITDRKAQNELIRHMALHDYLTGLPNRSLLMDRISQSIERRKRDGLLTAVMYIDLDGFKPINDTLGHGAGDEALREIGRRLAHSVRSADTAARVGGDEFVALLDGIHSRDEIVMVAVRISEAINRELIINETVFNIGASIGISIYPDDADNQDRLLALADRAMYNVKQTGKNRFAFFGDV